jgi:hypothetical protein
MSAPPPTCIVAADAPGSPTVPPPLVGIESDPPATQPPRADDSAASQKGPRITTQSFGCFDCKFGSDSPRKMVQHCRATGHRRSLPCIPCMATFPSKEKLDQVSSSENAVVQGHSMPCLKASHRNRYPCTSILRAWVV